MFREAFGGQRQHSRYRELRHAWIVCAGCGDYRWCHERNIGGHSRLMVCNRCTRSERRYLRQHPNTPHRSLTGHAGAHSVTATP